MSSKNFKKVSGRLEEEVKASLVDGFLPCPVALNIARRLRVKTKEVGYAADTLGLRIINCQLGCFKFEKAHHEDLEGKVISREVAERVRSSLVGGRLPCTAAHELSRELRVNLKEIGDTATGMNIKISDCQLNCFP
jgi:hypothetical protein